MTKIFKKYKITTLINLSIFQISNTTIDDAILERLQFKYENKISKYGYIKENSIEIIKRSAGTAMKEHFNSSFQFKAICYALICNPSIDTILKAEIVSSNNAGFKAEVKEKDKDKVIIDIIIPRLTAGIKHEYDIEDLVTGNSVYIKICRKRYHYNDNKIVVIGVVINNPTNDNDDDPDEFVDTVIPVNDQQENEVLIVSEDELEDDEEDDDDDDDDSVIDLVSPKEETDEDLDGPDDFYDKDLDEDLIDDIEDDF
tara:strand:- start:684 stop:1451 length:768 start_codon:yes stop_codon:yes gene_type:complete